MSPSFTETAIASPLAYTDKKMTAAQSVPCAKLNAAISDINEGVILLFCFESGYICDRKWPHICERMRLVW